MTLPHELDPLRNAAGIYWPREATPIVSPSVGGDMSRTRAGFEEPYRWHRRACAPSGHDYLAPPFPVEDGRAYVGWMHLTSPVIRLVEKTRTYRTHAHRPMVSTLPELRFNLSGHLNPQIGSRGTLIPGTLPRVQSREADPPIFAFGS